MNKQMIHIKYVFVYMISVRGKEYAYRRNPIKTRLQVDWCSLIGVLIPFQKTFPIALSVILNLKR